MTNFYQNSNSSIDDFEEEEITPQGSASNSKIEAQIFSNIPNDLGDDPKEPNEEKTQPDDLGQSDNLPKGKVNLGKLISGKAAVNVVNIFIPSFIVFAFSRFGYKTEKKNFKLSVEEKEILAQPLQDALDYIEVDFGNPFYTLAFCVIFIYGAKVMDAVPELSIIPKDLETDDENENETDAEIFRRKIDAESSWTEKNKLTIEYISNLKPQNIDELSKIYSELYPEKSTKQFTKWYEKNVGKFELEYQFFEKE